MKKFKAYLESGTYESIQEIIGNYVPDIIKKYYEEKPDSILSLDNIRDYLETISIVHIKNKKRLGPDDIYGEIEDFLLEFFRNIEIDEEEQEYMVRVDSYNINGFKDPPKNVLETAIRINPRSIEDTSLSKEKQDFVINFEPKTIKYIKNLNSELKDKYSHLFMGDKFGVFDDD